MNTQQTPIQKLLNIPIDNATYTDIHKAVIKGNLQRLKLYLDRGPGPWGTVDSLDWWGRSPLYRAVEKNYIPIVLEILIQIICKWHFYHYKLEIINMITMT